MRVGTLIFGAAKLVVYVYVFAIGIFFAADLIVVNGFGQSFVAGGVVIVFLAVASMVAAAMQYFGTKYHNRFILFVCYSTDALIVVFLVTNCLVLLEATVPEFSKDLQNSCLHHKLLVPAEDCLPFYNADRTAGFRLVWETYFSLATQDALQFQAITNLEGSECCGFFAPMRCVENNSSFPSNFGTKSVDSGLLSQRVVCGNKPGYYPQQTTCLDYFDAAVKPPVVGGCRYDMGLGRCLALDVTDTSKGCASAVEDLLMTRVVGHLDAMLGCTFLSVLCLCLSCCVWCKRKNYDVFPADQKPRQIEINYSEVKEAFQVQADANVLQKKGLVLTDDMLP